MSAALRQLLPRLNATGLVLLGVLAPFTFAPAMAGVELRVGSGCTYSTIQDAVDAIPNQGSGTIRIRSGTYVENVVISGKTAELLGGHGDCATTSPTGITNIDASGITSPAIAFFVIGGASDSSHALTTDSLNLFGGTGNGLANAGGINVFTDSGRTATITLQGTFVRNNQTTYRGGGIALYGDGSGSLALLENSQLENNVVTGDNPYGGGLYCSGDYSVIMIGGSIHGNTAGVAGTSNARGGGVYLDGCAMAWYAQSQTSAADDASLRNNRVWGNGGGIHAIGGADVELIGASFSFGSPASTRPLRIRTNRAEGVSVGGGTAGGQGGAIYALGAGTQVTADRTWIYDNHAEATGGAINVRDGAVVNVIRGSEVCHNPRSCSRIYDNHGVIDGGAATVRGAELNVRRTIIQNNTSVFGGILTRGSVSGFESTIRLEDSLMHGDFGPGHALANWGGTLRIERSTVADTQPTVAVIGLDGVSSLTIFDSIIHEAGGQDIVNVNGGTPTIGIDCVVWHDDSLASMGTATNTEIADPKFADRDNALYYLQPGSPAINYCGVAPPPPGVDLEWNPRGICHSVEPPLCPVEQIYDLGAYEFPLGLFRDRFEGL